MTRREMTGKMNVTQNEITPSSREKGENESDRKYEVRMIIASFHNYEQYFLLISILPFSNSQNRF